MHGFFFPFDTLNLVQTSGTGLKSCVLYFFYFLWAIPHLRGKLSFGRLNEPTVTCCVDEVSSRLGIWSLVLALAYVFVVGA
jgi:hypothetical protein